MYTEQSTNNKPHNGDYFLVPTTDIYETTDNYTLKLEMPGVVRESLDITLDKNELQIKAAPEEYKPDKRERVYSEFIQNDYYRSFTVGSDIDRNGINASFENGVLTIVLQKHESVKPRKIAINVS